MSLLKQLKSAFGNPQEEETADDLAFDNEELDFEISTEKDVKITQKADTLAEVDVKYPLIKPFAYAHVKWDEDKKELLYNLEEPNLTEDDHEALELIQENLSEKLDVSLDAMKDRGKVINYLERKINELLVELGVQLEEEQHKKIMYYVYRDFVGLGKIEPFMHDPYIEDLGCDGTDIPVFAVHSEFGSVKSDVRFEEEADLKNLVIKLAERCGKYVSYANPLLDGALPDGSRVNASLTEDVTAHGPTFSIRKFQETPFSAVDMIDLGTADAKIMAYMWLAEQYQQSYLITGGTATGKTSFLNSIVSFIPPEDKIVSIEDTRELRLPHENWIPSITRSMFGSDSGSDVDMDKLLKESFRENPDYVIVGEVRGEEASVLFQGMSSGHPSIGTMHASGPNDVVKRLVTPPISLSPALVESLDIVVAMTHAKGVEKSARRVREVHEIQKVMQDSQSARTNNIFSWTAREDSFRKRGMPHMFEEISEDYGVSKDKLQEELEKRTKVLNWLKEKGVTDFEKVSELIQEYYKNKEKIMKTVSAEEGDYSLEDIIEAEERVDLSRRGNLENEMEQDRKDMEKKEEQKIPAEFDGDMELEEKKHSEPNPVAELEEKLQQEREKVEKIKDRTEKQQEEDPFGGQPEVKEDPFRA
ncbi:MAG: ATPase, T2SS/T4P/T4SS family [Candidatus Nanohaloarchaea archaeon]